MLPAVEADDAYGYAHGALHRGLRRLRREDLPRRLARRQPRAVGPAQRRQADPRLGPRHDRHPRPVPDVQPRDRDLLHHRDGPAGLRRRQRRQRLHDLVLLELAGQHEAERLGVEGPRRRGATCASSTSRSPDGIEHAELGMAWAPEATWVDDYYADGSGAFVVYWSSNVYTNAAHTGSSYSPHPVGRDARLHAGLATTTAASSSTAAATRSTPRSSRTTARPTASRKDNCGGQGHLHGVDAPPPTGGSRPRRGRSCRRRSARLAGGNAGGVEGPAVFQRPRRDHWYLYVDVIPSHRLPADARPPTSTPAGRSSSRAAASRWRRAPSTAASSRSPRAATTRSAKRMPRPRSTATSAASRSRPAPTAAAVRDALPGTAEVVLAYGRGVARAARRRGIWRPSTPATPGAYEVTGTVRTIGANLNQWVGAGGSTAWNAPGRSCSARPR